jgi:hypothetical protein
MAPPHKHTQKMTYSYSSHSREATKSKTRALKPEVTKLGKLNWRPVHWFLSKVHTQVQENGKERSADSSKGLIYSVVHTSDYSTNTNSQSTDYLGRLVGETNY